MARILFFALKVALVYIILFLPFKFLTPLTPGYYRLLAAGGNAVFDLIESSPSVTVSSHRDILWADFPKGDVPRIKFEQGYELNLILVLALFLATPNLKLSKRLQLTALTALLLVLIQLFFLAFDIKLIQHVMLTMPGEPAPPSLDRINSSIMYFQDVLPVMLWMVMGFRYFKGWLHMPKAVRGVGRNEPCPCGSGLKYKKCCGRR